jgi:hypothetical protein
MMFLYGVIGQPRLEHLGEVRALLAQAKVVARRHLFPEQAIPLVGIGDHLMLVRLWPVLSVSVVAVQLPVVPRQPPRPHEEIKHPLRFDEEVERHIALPGQHELAGSLDLPRHALGNGHPRGCGDGRADHHRRAEVLKAAAGEVTGPDLPGRLFERTPFVERGGCNPDIEEAAERLARDRGGQAGRLREPQRLRRPRGRRLGGRGIPETQGLAQLPDFVGESGARRIGLRGRPGRGIGLRQYEAVERLTHDLRDDQLDRLALQFRDCALRHDPMLDPFHRGEENGCPLHRLGQDMRAQRNGEAGRPPSVHDFFRQAPAELPGSGPAPEVGGRAQRRAGSAGTGSACNRLRDTLCDIRPDRA